MRSKYDDLKTQSNAAQAHIDKMKGNIEILKQDEAKYRAIYDKQKNVYIFLNCRSWIALAIN